MPQSSPLQFWILTDETSVDICDGMSVVGLFASPEKARDYLFEHTLGDNAKSIEWVQASEAVWEGHDEMHWHCYLLTRHSTAEII